MRKSVFPPKQTCVMADFLCDVADGSDRPKSQLSTATAAISCYYEITRVDNIMQDTNIRRLVDSLIKTQTLAPRVHTPVMPIQPFMDIFLTWPDNVGLSTHQLRIKAITLLAFAVMLRPSDIAPKAEVYDGEEFVKLELTCNQLRFEDDGSLTIWLHGIKNDSKRDGFQINIPAASNPTCDPVATLRTYIARTEADRPASRPVFIALKKPFKAISSATVAKDLASAIQLAGLSGHGFSAKSFRPTGATAAIESGINPDNVRTMGRWKCREVFEEHYVFPRVGQEFTDTILGV